ncbi:heavy metal translocating P-type ATPase [Oryzifoliimicrobium ureilyticus]|uniref:heavy metal translocating P-type ATPase n=1 Tax=Oryzifoliimicrobium ureilyticus TaxID=3113724 RepID=UPI003F674DB1
MLNARYKVSGMDCASCATKIDTAVRRVSGVKEVSVSVSSETLSIEHDATADLLDIERRVRRLGYEVAALPQSSVSDSHDHACSAHEHEHEHEHHQHEGHEHHSHHHDDDHDHQHASPHEKHSDVKHDGVGFQETRFAIGGMDCASCAAKIETAVRRLDTVDDVTVSVTSGKMTVRHANELDPQAVEKQVKALGYTIHRQGSKPNSAHEHLEGLHGHSHAPQDGPWWRSGKGRLTIYSGLALVAAYVIGHLVPAAESWLFIAAMLVGLIPIARRAIMAALMGTPFSIEMLMTIAAVGAVIINAGEEAATVVFLFLVGELLEGVAAGRARASIRSLTDLVPKTALIEENGKTRSIPADKLALDDILLVRPGDRIAADGIIESGESGIDEAPVTGESVPVRKTSGDAVFAGTVNGDAALRVKVTASANDNTIARVIKLVEEAQEAKAPTERFIDRFSRWYTPAVVVVAALVAVLPPLLGMGDWSAWIYKGLAVLLIGCPCALVISTPAAIAAALSAGARRGLLIKGGAVLENLGKVTAIAFDKTGTLTQGKAVVTDVIGFGLAEADLLRFSAAVETGSSHPLAVAILKKAEADQIEVPAATDAKAIGGKGVAAKVTGKTVFLGSPSAASEQMPLTEQQKAEIVRLNDAGKTVSVLILDGSVAGIIALRDEPREDAASALKELSAKGMRTVMLTGDNQRTAKAVGAKLGIEVRSELLPQDKQKIVGELKREGFVVAKVGDGINDAPALAAADIGIAMGGGTDVALETADAAVLHGRVSDVLRMIDLSNRAMRNIRQNILIAVGLKAVFLVTTILGVTGLWPAILADTGATVLVTINALRLLRQA